ncbi:sulfate adenylyltransferase subunit CysN [Enterobacterales bacterium endosymbiont of Anomoneura mori]
MICNKYNIITKKNIFKKYLKLHKNKSLLKFLTCGSVDDGKSTLIGRLLHDTKQICEDHLFELKKDIKGTQGSKLDLSLLVDGLEAEREQGITIDIAYRYFSTEKRKFIIADTPGHEQYTRNMATAASNCDLAILLIDSRKGVLKQTRRHSYICTLLGIQNLLVTINKMDLINYNKLIFNKIVKDYLSFVKYLPNKLNVIFIPISALNGDNIIKKSNFMNWYKGPTIIEVLETVDVISELELKPLRFPVQYINRPNQNFRGYSGNISSGIMRVGQKIKILPYNIKSTIKRIVTFDKDLPDAIVGESITLVLEDNIDISKGDIIINELDNITLSNRALIKIVWLNEILLSLNEIYNVKILGKKIEAKIITIQYKCDVNTLVQYSSNNIYLNNIGLIEVVFNDLLILDTYFNNRNTGNLIFINKNNNSTIGAGLIKKIFI